MNRNKPKAITAAMKKIFFLVLFLTYRLLVNGQTERTITLSSLLASKTDTLGVAFLDDETLVLIGETINKIDQIHSIQRWENGYKMTPVNPNAFRLNGLQVDYHGALVLSEVGRLPDLNLPNNTTKPVDFFKTGFSFQNAVNTKFRFTPANVIELAFGQNRGNNPVPHSQQDVYNASLKADKWKWKKFTTDLGISGSSRANRLTNFGASHARLFNAVLTDNLSQYPYRELPDKSETKELLTWLKTKYKNYYNFGKRDFEAEASLSFNKQWDKREMGMTAPATSPLLRNEELSELRAGLSANYGLDIDRRREHYLNLSANYSFSRNENDVNRMNQQVFDGFRNAHEIRYGIHYDYRYDNRISIDLTNKHYFSNTAQNYNNFFPSGGIAIDLEDFLSGVLDDLFWDWWYSYYLNQFKLFGSAGRSLGEASLVYRNYSALTTEISAASALSNFYEAREILSQTKKMTPEIYENYEAGLETTFSDRRVSLSFIYFNNTTRNMIAPHNNAGQFFLQNIGDMRNDGFLINTSFSNYYTRNVKFSINFNFSKMKSKALRVADGPEKIALAGFSDVGTYFAKGEPLGVIFGTTYQRTDDGAIAVNDNGVPLINSELKRIGDPTPNFTIGIAPDLSWQKVDFSLNMEYNNGGDRWNGTKAFVENLSAKAVEDYIEDASFWRLSQVLLSYRVITNKYRWVVRDMKIGVSVQNLFVVSHYKGVDPATHLFGYSTGKGLDFFNMPSVRSYQFVVNMKF